MGRGIRRVICWISAFLLGGCGSIEQPPQSVPQPIRVPDVLGKWRLIRADGQPPSSLNIKSLELELTESETWTSHAEMEGAFAGMKLDFSGKWSLVDGVVSYSAGANSGKSRIRFESGRLIVDPDFTLRKEGTTEVTGEYEKQPR